MWAKMCERLLRVPWTARRSNQSILKEISPGCSFRRINVEAAAPILWPPDAGKEWGQEEKGTTEDEMVGWDHRLNGHEFEQSPGVGGGQESLACCSPWSCKERDVTEWLNNNNKILFEGEELGKESNRKHVSIYVQCGISYEWHLQSIWRSRVRSPASFRGEIGVSGTWALP